MDKFQRKLRLVIATGSAVGFLGGWALLAHAGKPVSTVTTAPVVESVTLPPIDFKALEASGNSSNGQSFMTQPTFQTFSRPRLRTGGS
jgi:hypothetical protein